MSQISQINIQKIKVKLIELYVKDIDLSDEYSEISSTKHFYSISDSVEWEEVTVMELNVLKNWVRQKNRPYGNKKYVIAIESEKSALDTVKQVLKEEDKRRRESEKNRVKWEKEEEAKKLARKKKQLEKLKAELGAAK